MKINMKYVLFIDDPIFEVNKIGGTTNDYTVTGSVYVQFVGDLNKTLKVSRNFMAGPAQSKAQILSEAKILVANELYDLVTRSTVEV